MKRAIIIAVVIPLLAGGCGKKRLKVTYKSDPPGGGLYKLNGEFWGPCPKVLWYDLNKDAKNDGHLEARGLIVRWPSGPEKRSDELIRIPVDGTDQEVTFVQPKVTAKAPQAPDPEKEPQQVVAEATFTPDPELREEKDVVAEATFAPDPELREERDDETVWIRRRTSTVNPPSEVTKQRKKETVQVTATLKTVDFGNGLKIEFALIPAGELTLDSTPDGGRADSFKGRGRTIKISKPFYMSVYEVTQEQYEEVMNANPSRYPGPRNPVDTVSWNDAERFCRILSSKGKGQCFLPTESQWEYACRAGATTAYYWGDTFDARYAWVITNSDSSTHEVGTRLPNAWGLHDMAGNVWEWCQNWYGQPDLKSAEQTGRKAPSKGKYRILRGGSWGHAPSSCRSAQRNWHTPNHRYDDCGFRIVLEAE